MGKQTQNKLYKCMTKNDNTSDIRHFKLITSSYRTYEERATGLYQCIFCVNHHILDNKVGNRIQILQLSENKVYRYGFFYRLYYVYLIRFLKSVN